MSVSIVIPTYNEKENIGKLIEAIFDLNIDNLCVLVVDDNSLDGTVQIVEKLRSKYPVDILKRTGKRGLGGAYIAGFNQVLKSQTDYIFEMDADFSHRPEDVPKLLRAAQEGYDLVLGSRRIPGGQIQGWNWRRHFSSWGAMSFSRLVLGLKTKDATTGFRCFKRQVLEKINWGEVKSNGYAFQEEVLLLCERMGCRIKEVPITFVDRKLGKSKLGFKDIVEFFIRILYLKFKK